MFWRPFRAVKLKKITLITHKLNMPQTEDFGKAWQEGKRAKGQWGARYLGQQIDQPIESIVRIKLAGGFF
jgi:hypothetical protein